MGAEILTVGHSRRGGMGTLSSAVRVSDSVRMSVSGRLFPPPAFVLPEKAFVLVHSCGHVLRVRSAATLIMPCIFIWSSRSATSLTSHYDNLTSFRLKTVTKPLQSQDPHGSGSHASITLPFLAQCYVDDQRVDTKALVPK